MILQAPSGHKLINQEPAITLRAVSNKFNQIRMTELAKIINFCLQMWLQNK